MAMTKAEKWWEENVVNDAEELEQIGELAARMLREKLRIEVSPITLIAIYCVTFESILRVLKKKQKEFKSYSINIAGCINVSYNTLEDDTSEKEGNFAPFIQQISTGSLPDSGLDPSAHKTIELCTAWNESHIVEQPDVISEIAGDALRHFLDELGLKTFAKEAVIPIFGIVHDTIISWLKLRRVDTKSVSASIDVAGLYQVEVVETNEGTENVEYECSVSTKLGTKDDMGSNNVE